MSTSALTLTGEAVPRSVDGTLQMRVCHIMSADLWAGAEVQVATTAAYLVNGRAVNLSAVLLNEGQLARQLRQLGVAVAVVDETRTSALGIVIALVRFLRKHRIQLVHTHRYKDTVLGLIAAKIAGVPCAVRTVHGLREPMTGWAHVKFAVYEALEKAVLRCCADRIIAVSQHMVDVLRDSGYPATRLTQIHNGINVDIRSIRRRRDVRRELGVGPDTHLIGTVGRLSPVKGHATLLRAAGRILQSQPRAKFLIVGDGPLRADLQALAADLRIDNATLFAGHRVDVHDLLSAMNVFVLPSLSEGIPMALLEAMALGTPVVATAVGGVPEVVRHGVNGLLVRSGDERAMADACIELTIDLDLAERLSIDGRRTVQERFSYARSGEALTRVYHDVASSRDVGDTGARAVARPDSISEVVRVLRRFVAHRIACARGRRRMAEVRRNPASLKALARSARRVLVVCHGNIIRSPFAERLLRRALGSGRSPTVSSAGLYALSGNPPHQYACATAMSRSISLDGHTASPLSRESVTASDLILVMDIWQLVEIVGRYPDAREKTYLFTCLAPDVPLEVQDPVNGDQTMYEACFEHIERAAAPLIAAMTGDAGSLP